MSEGPVLRPEEVAGVLSGMEASATPAATTPAPLPYSLREPVALPPEAEPEARKKVEMATAGLAEILTRALEAEVKIEVEGFQQQRAASVIGVLAPPVWVVSFTGAAGGGGVAVLLHPGLGLALVELALGGIGKPEESGRAPTPAELRVLSRLAAEAMPRMSETFGGDLSHFDTGVGTVPAAIADPGETVGVGVLRAHVPEGDGAALMLVSASLLTRPAPTAEETVRGRPGPLAAKLGSIRLKLLPVLPAGRASVSELSELKPGVVLRLDASEETLLSLRVGGSSVFRGQIVRSMGGAAFRAAWRRGRTAAGGEKP